MKVDTDIRAGTIQVNGSGIGQLANAQLQGVGAALAGNLAVVNQLNINVSPTFNITVA